MQCTCSRYFQFFSAFWICSVFQLFSHNLIFVFSSLWSKRKEPQQATTGHPTAWCTDPTNRWLLNQRACEAKGHWRWSGTNWLRCSIFLKPKHIRPSQTPEKMWKHGKQDWDISKYVFHDIYIYIYLCVYYVSLSIALCNTI